LFFLLGDRDSTDSSWSDGPASLYEDVSGHTEEEEDKREYEAVMELKAREDEIVTAEETAAKARENGDASAPSRTSVNSKSSLSKKISKTGSLGRK